MEIYRVGGVVRDALLGLPASDCDYVVVGAKPEEMRALGFQEVGRDFPVFLHPQSHEEYALARTERKIARGHGGFRFNAAPTVTLEEDLSRRDLTINAIAQNPQTGALIDPYGGARDLTRKVLRHVSAAFAEDPLRVLRLARFYARFRPLGFTIAPETLTLARSMAPTLRELSGERIWGECAKALALPEPGHFFTALAEFSALPALLGTAALPLAQCQQSLSAALAAGCSSIAYRLAAWLLPAPQAAAALLSHLPVPNAVRAAVQLLPYGQHWAGQDVTQRFEFLKRCGALRGIGELDAALQALGCDAGRRAQIRATLAPLWQLTPQPFLDQGLRGAELGAALAARQKELLRAFDAA